MSRAIGRRVLILIGTSLLVAAATAWYWPHAVLVPTIARDGIVDIHVHTAGIGAGDSGIIVGAAIRESYKFEIYLEAFGVTLAQLERDGDVAVLRRISEQVARSTRVEKAVVLAIDGVVDENGELDLERTQLHVPGEFLERELAAFGNLLYGASVNPRRPDAIARLERARARGAVLVKWIPGIMAIDPADEAYIPFYDRLRELGLPLLTHAGRERSFGVSDDELGDPLRLRLPLERGVTVIAAHVASTGSVDGLDNFDRALPLFDEFENLYADVSALTQVNRRGYLPRAVAMQRLRGRLLYGSDWPLQFFPLVSPWYQWPGISAAEAKAIQAIDNAWDRDVALKEAMGVAPEVLIGSGRLLGLAR